MQSWLVYRTHSETRLIQWTCSPQEKRTRGVVFSVNSSMNGAVFNAGGALGGVMLLMFMHVGAIELTPNFVSEH